MKTEIPEQSRLRAARTKGIPWRKWGPYLSERQWGTVREDYSPNGDAWNYFTHNQARARAYRWGEDGIAGFCDERMRLCFAIALWNGKDPFLKERMFGLTATEGNHGEDVKEYYFYLDCTPTYSYAKMLYKYPQAAFPYDDLVETNRNRNRRDPEYELLDTGVFDGDRYFDVVVEYAKAGPEDILIRISATNRGPEPAALHILPQLWFRNTWWDQSGQPIPRLSHKKDADGPEVIVAQHTELGERFLACDHAATLLFTNNETNVDLLFGMPNPSPFVKDGINNFVVSGRREAVNRQYVGTKAAALYPFELAPGETQNVQLRLTDQSPAPAEAWFGPAFEGIFSERQCEAEEFYASVIPETANVDAARLMRQGFAGMLWSKEVYIYPVNRWLKDHSGGQVAKGDDPTPIRNSQWSHLDCHDVISVPDKWEYPWFSAWDLAFQSVPLSLLDPEFAGKQFELMLRERYLHPSGQMPAYENNFDAINPPVHAWAALFSYRIARGILGERALDMLKGAFHRLLLNFTWWMNRKDMKGRNIFEGGFLDLDNIGIFDRSVPLPSGGYLELADGTAWMAFFAQNMLEISVELAMHDPVYEDLAIRFYEHFVLIAGAMSRMGEANDTMWDEADGFYYNLLRLPDGSTRRLKIRSMAGLLPLCAVTVCPAHVMLKLPQFVASVQWFNQQRPELLASICPPRAPGVQGRYLLGILTEQRLRRVLARVLDPNEFLGDYGIRSLSRYHLERPYVFEVGGKEYRVGYSPAEANTDLFGGNTNWQGPVWAPENALLIRALVHMYSFYGNNFRVECPTGSGVWMNLFEIARELVNRMARIFLRGKDERRPVYGAMKKFQEDPYWRDHLLFYEYFQGDHGGGLGASHQTGWSGLVPAFLCLFERLFAEDVLELGHRSVLAAIKKTSGNATDTWFLSRLGREEKQALPAKPARAKRAPRRVRRPRHAAKKTGNRRRRLRKVNN